MAELKGLSGKSYRTQGAPFAGGGEGDVYDVIGVPGFVAKVYKPDKRTKERERKLSVMVSNKPNVMEQYAWPLDVLYENGQFIGYVMPKINGKEKLRNIYVYDKRKGKPWSLYIAIAKNLSAAVHNVHEIHQVIGDLNPENILVNPNDGMVTLVDTDSYHISDGSRTYRCGVSMPEFVAPELQGIHFPSAPLPTFTPESDRFALAVLIFALLMNGAHPFSCKVISGSSSKFQPIDNIQNGKCAFFLDSRSRNMDIPRYAPDLSSLPENIQKLFRRAFVTGCSMPSLRPTAEEWYNALEQLEANLKTCLKDPQHIYYYGAKECPWCSVEAKMKSVTQTAFKSQTSNLAATVVPPISSAHFSPYNSQVSALKPPTASGYTPNVPKVYSSPTNTFAAKSGSPKFKKEAIIATLLSLCLFVIIVGVSISSIISSKEMNATETVKYVEDIWLSDLEYLKCDEGVHVSNQSNGKTNTGEEYSHRIYSQQPYSEVSYHLNGQYNRMTALWTIAFSDRDEAYNNSFVVYADEILVYESPTITAGDLPVNVDIDINYCNVLTILFKEGYGAAELGDVLLSSTESMEVPINVMPVPTLSCWLTDLNYLTNNDVIVMPVSPKLTNTGAQYRHFIYGEAGTSIEYYLQGQYDTLTGMWTIDGFDCNTTSVEAFEVYADDILVYSSPALTGGDLPVDVEVNIGNCQKLKIAFTSGNGDAEFANIRLSQCNS